MYLIFAFLARMKHLPSRFAILQVLELKQCSNFGHLYFESTHTYCLFPVSLTLSQFFWIIAEETQPAITCSKLTTETLDQGVIYVQS